MQAVLNAGTAFSPLDEELGLLPGRYTSRLQEGMVRLGAKLSYRQAQEELAHFCRIQVGEKTIRDETKEAGSAREAYEQAGVAAIEKGAPEPKARPNKMLFSGDGAFVPLISGEWREVKTLVLGEFDTVTNAKGEQEVCTEEISYFSRSYRAREFERSALIETHRRGVENAEKVVAVNDGAAWLQNLVTCHAPEAVRILDFSHAQGYVADAGKAWFGENNSEFSTWFKRASHDLKHAPPEVTLTRLRELHQQAQGQRETQEVIAQSLAYLSKRTAMIDYSHFVDLHFPIGSGSVESGNKLVMQSRMKQAGMRWHPENVDPMLTLRCLICNDRWGEGWREIVHFRQQQRLLARQQRTQQRRTTPQVVPNSQIDPVNTPSSIPAPLPKSPKSKQPYRPPADHPWRRPFLNKAAFN
jgi:hypothetical protein